MEKYIKLFEKLGIWEKMTRIYLDLLEYGTSSIADICQRTDLHRPEVYRSLPFLIESVLIRELTKWKRTLYAALPPERIEDMIREFEKRNTPLVSELRAKYDKLENQVSVSYQEWRSGVTRVFSDIVDTLPRGSVFYRVSAERDVERSNTYLPSDYRAKRDKKQLERMVISSGQAAAPKQKRLERDIVRIPQEYDEFDQDVTMTIYGDKIAYIDYTHEHSIIIENPMIAEFQRKLFLLLHKKLKK